MKKILLLHLIIISSYPYSQINDIKYEVEQQGNQTHQEKSLENPKNISPVYSLQELQKKFSHKKYTDNILLCFQKSMGNPNAKPMLHEFIPGEVIAWSWVDGRFAVQKEFLVQKDSLRLIKARPRDKAFIDKLNSFVPKKSHFSYSSDLWTFPYIKKKTEDGYYIIKANVKSFNSRPMIPNDDILFYNIVYKTKDFENFSLIKLKDVQQKNWIQVEEY